jgi:hypothetical protein
MGSSGSVSSFPPVRFSPSLGTFLMNADDMLGPEHDLIAELEIKPVITETHWATDQHANVIGLAVGKDLNPVHLGRVNLLRSAGICIVERHPDFVTRLERLLCAAIQLPVIAGERG